jgi:hypothetical protein
MYKLHNQPTSSTVLRVSALDKTKYDRTEQDIHFTTLIAEIAQHKRNFIIDC